MTAAMEDAWGQQDSMLSAPDPALVGRWLGKSVLQSAEYESYLAWTLTAGGNFVVAVEAQNRKTKQWALASAVLPEEMKKAGMFSPFGSYQVAPPKYLLLKMFGGFVDLPIDVHYAIAGGQLTVTPGTNANETLPWLAGVFTEVDQFEFDQSDAQEPMKPAAKTSGKKRTNELSDMITHGGEGMANLAASGKLDETHFDFHHYYFQPATERWVPHPSDAEMIAAFKKHAEVFQKEEAMHREDGTQPVTAERQQVYQKLEEGAVPNSAVGMFGHGSAKRYAWLAAPPKEDGAQSVTIDGDLDAYVDQRNKNRREKHQGEAHPAKDPFTVYRHLEGNWYLVYEQD